MVKGAVSSRKKGGRTDSRATPFSSLAFTCRACYGYVKEEISALPCRNYRLLISLSTQTGTQTGIVAV